MTLRLLIRGIGPLAIFLQFLNANSLKIFSSSVFSDALICLLAPFLATASKILADPLPQVAVALYSNLIHPPFDVLRLQPIIPISVDVRRIHDQPISLDP